MQPPSRAALGDLASRYLSALLAARRGEAARLALDAVESGAVTVRELYLEVFEPVLIEVGRRWEQGEVSIAQEHFITAATQLVMAQLYPRIFAAARRGRTMVAACGAHELHEIGLRMVADFFELDGWDTYYVGANVPPVALLATVRERRAGLLALSAMMPRQRRFVGEVIAALRATPDLASTLVLVGGGAFRGAPSLWREVGADGHTTDAASAVELANRLVASARRDPR